MGKTGIRKALLEFIGSQSTERRPARLQSVGQLIVLALIGMAFASSAQAGEVCSQAAQAQGTYAGRIAAVACNENTLWFSPFIDINGRLANMAVSEAEGARLRDGGTPAWQRVVEYWKGSGLLWRVSGFAGAGDCGYPDAPRMQSASCRAFLVDNPWSAVFVSYVMNRAGVPGFRPSASHVDYVRDAYQRPESSPYTLADPDTTPPALGDMLCFARMRASLGPQGLRDFLAQHPLEGLNMHCDIVVAVNPGGDSKVYLVGGNVLQGVTMRVLPLNRNGLVWGLPRRGPSDCHAGNEEACGFNRQDWVALLKLKALPAPVSPMTLAPSQPTPMQCCDVCPLPMPEGMQRCPAQGTDPALNVPRQ
ncbi:DUF2272 domain-containing protein [Lysobacter fragariae]